MTLIQATYQSLKQAKLTTTREAFSRDFVNRSKCWYSYVAHMKRDFSAAAAIDCLRSIRALQERREALTPDQLHALMSAEIELHKHLREHHRVSAVSDV